MNILILNWKDIKNPTAGGAELVTFEHAKRWVKSGHSVTWLASAFSKSQKEEVVDGVNIRRFGNIYQVYFYAPFFYLFGKKKYDFVIDEVHGIPFFTPFYVRKPKLVLIHEIAGDIWDYMYSFPLNKLGRFLENVFLVLYRNNMFWTDSKSTIQDLVSCGVKRQNCISIPCASNVKPLDRIVVKSKNITIVSISRIVKMKGIEDVIAAFSVIQSKHNNAQLKIVGDGSKEYVNFLKKQIKNKYNLEKNIEFLGFISEKEKIKLLKKSHLLIHASVKEGWGIVVIEAASQSTPSVVYNTHGLVESVKNDVTGVVTNINNFHELGNDAIELLEDKKRYKKYQENCLSWAKELNWDDLSNKSLKLINKILNEK